MQNHYNHKNRRKYNLKAHIVLVTKYRKTLLQYGLDDFVKRAIIYLAGQNNWTVIAMETDYCWNTIQQSVFVTSSAS